MKTRIQIAATLLVVLVTSVLSFGQAATASSSLAGTVTDSSGAVVVGANVTATDIATGTTRSSATSDTGSYRFDLLPPGVYAVKVSRPGFAAITADRVELLIARTTTQNFTLKPGVESQTVTVTGEAPVLDQEKTSVGLEITPAQVENLPLNGRDFANLAYLAPGVKPVNSYDPTKNRIAVFAVNGSSGRNVNITVNGIDDKDGTVGGPVMQLPLEAVQEFNISTQRFSAANGRSEGAAVNVVTKRGTNRFHGGAYFFDTETALNANDKLNEKNIITGVATGNPTPQFIRKQIGGSLGGPVVKDKDFLFFALEHTREHTQIPVSSLAFNELTTAKNAGLPAQPVTAIPTPYFDWRYTGRFDHQINQNHSVFLAYSNQHNHGINDQDGNTVDATQNNFTTNQLILSNLTLNSVLSPRVVNAFTAGFQYWNNLIDSNTKVPLYSFTDASFGTNGNVAQQSFQRKWQFKDDISISRGNHAFKTGVDYLWEPVIGGFFQSNGTLTFAFFDDPSVITTNKTKYPNGFATAGAVKTMSQSAGDPHFLEHVKMFGAYFEDDWKARRNLTLNLGLRYDKDSGMLGEDAIPNARTYLALKAINSPFAARIPHQDNLDFSPRVGFAWDLSGVGKHVIRGGYGLYYGQTFQNIPLFMEQQANPILYAQLFSITHSSLTTSCAASVCAVPGTSIPLSSWRYGVDPMPTLPAAKTVLPANSTGRLVDPNYRNPYSQQWNLGYAYELSPSTVLEVDGVHEIGVHESKRLNINYIDPTKGTTRILAAALAAAGQPALGSIIDETATGRSRYDGLNISMRRRMAHHFSLTSTYTLSRAVGYQGPAAAFGNVSTIPTNPFRPEDFGDLASDERHRWVNSAVVDLPWGFQVSPIMQWASARPFNATMAVTDVFGLGSGNGSIHAIGQAADPLHTLLSTKDFSAAQFQSCLAAATCKELHFNDLRGQAFFQLDTRVTKMIKFGERANLKLMFQGFDVTNRSNFGASFGGNTSSASFGKPTNYITPSGTIVPKSFRAEFGAQFTF